MRACLLALALVLTACGDGAEPPVPAPAAEATGPERPPAEPGDGLLALAAANPQLGTFARAVRVAGLRDELSQEGPLTVFAPSDEAFAQLGDLDALLADPEALAARLRAHVLPTRMLAADVFAPIGIETVSGAEIEVDATPSGGVTVRSGTTTATVIVPDLDASNGVIHVIDAVL